MTDWTTQGINLQVGDGASPEVFTTIADVTNHNEFGVSRSRLDTTKLNSNVRTTKPGLPAVSDLQFEGTYDPNNATVASLWTKLTTEDQADTNWKLDLDTSPNEVWSFSGYIADFMLLPNSPDGLQRFRATIAVNAVPTQAAT